MRQSKLLSIIALSLIASVTAQASYVAPPYPITKGGTGVASQTAHKAVTTDASGNVVSTSATTDTQIGYLSTLSSDVQTQLGTKAATDLSNLASTAVNASIVPGTTGAVNLGSSSKLWLDAYLTTIKDASSVVSVDPLSRLLKNSSGNTVVDYSSTLLKSSFPLQLLGSTSGSINLSSGSTPTAHTVTLPPTNCLSGQYWADNGSGVMACTSPVSANYTVADGGNTAYTISTEKITRSGTTLTANRAYTLPACTAGNIGELHIVKNTPAQTFNITLTAAGSDLIDGNATYVLFPGDSVTVTCDFFSSAGTWDIQ